MNDLIFIRLDGDNIGDKIEFSLMENNWILAQNTHDNVQLGMKKIFEYINSIPHAKILLKGCDDILFSMDKKSFNSLILSELQRVFFEECHFTLSIGVGESVNLAIYNLRKAKLSGKNTVIY